MVRLPQDVGSANSGDTRGVPDLTTLQGDVAEYLAMQAREDDFTTRALGCWGLVARWPASRDIVASLLRSTREENVEDAAGILGRVGIPADMLSTVLDLIEALPDSTGRDCLVQSLPLGHPRRAPDAAQHGDVLEALAGVPLQGAWEPYTSHIQFIEAPFDVVTKAFAGWMRRGMIRDLLGRLGLTDNRHEYKLTRHSGSLAELLSLLDPYWWPSKHLFVETQFGFTAVFSNGHETYDSFHLSEVLGVRAVVTDFSVDLVIKGEVVNYGGTTFELLDKGESVRTVQVTRQSGGWDVVILGTPQPFEEVDRYQSRIKRDRFDLDMLNRYCAGLGITRSDDRLYGQRGFMYTPTGKQPQPHQYPTAAAWRKANLFPSGTE
jgi:hypothetical protein